MEINPHELLDASAGYDQLSAAAAAAVWEARDDQPVSGSFAGRTLGWLVPFLEAADTAGSFHALAWATRTAVFGAWWAEQEVLSSAAAARVETMWSVLTDRTLDVFEALPVEVAHALADDTGLPDEEIEMITGVPDLAEATWICTLVQLTADTPEQHRGVELATRVLDLITEHHEQAPIWAAAEDVLLAWTKL